MSEAAAILSWVTAQAAMPVLLAAAVVLGAGADVEDGGALTVGEVEARVLGERTVLEPELLGLGIRCSIRGRGP